MSRKRSGNLTWRASGWRARIWIDENGVAVRKFIDLETTNKSVAKRKLARLVSKVAAGVVEPDAVDVEAVRYTVEDFAKGHYDARSKWVKSWQDEKRIYESCLKPRIGASELGHVTAQDILDCLNDAATTRAHESVKKVRAQASALFKAARLAGLTSNNPLDGLKTPAPRRKKLPRAILTDDEFARYVAFPHAVGHKRPPGTVDLEIKVMGIVARTIGGQRGSDVHALEWPAVDLIDFASMMVRRPKTEHLSDELVEDEYEVPLVARPFLRAWWEAKGRPTKGPVFPNRRGKEVGKPKGKVSHAWALRRDIRRAFGVDVAVEKKIKRSNGRVLTSWIWKPARELTAREVELFEGTARNRPLDFHSFRRAFATGLRRAKVDARDAMRLAAHTSFETHQRYVQDDGPIAAPPDAALPKLPAVSPILRLGTGRSQSRRSSVQEPNSSTISSGWQDLNLQQPAPKESGATVSSVVPRILVFVPTTTTNEKSAAIASIRHRSVPNGVTPARIAAERELSALLRARADALVEAMGVVG